MKDSTIAPGPAPVQPPVAPPSPPPVATGAKSPPATPPAAPVTEPKAPTLPANGTAAPTVSLLPAENGDNNTQRFALGLQLAAVLPNDKGTAITGIRVAGEVRRSFRGDPNGKNLAMVYSVDFGAGGDSQRGAMGIGAGVAVRGTIPLQSGNQFYGQYGLRTNLLVVHDEALARGDSKTTAGVGGTGEIGVAIPYSDDKERRMEIGAFATRDTNQAEYGLAVRFSGY